MGETWHFGGRGRDAEYPARARTALERERCQRRRLHPLLDAVLLVGLVEPRPRIHRATGERPGQAPARGLPLHRRAPNSLQPPRHVISRLLSAAITSVIPFRFVSGIMKACQRYSTHR